MNVLIFILLGLPITSQASGRCSIVVLPGVQWNHYRLEDGYFLSLGRWGHERVRLVYGTAVVAKDSSTFKAGSRPQVLDLEFRFKGEKFLGTETELLFRREDTHEYLRLFVDAKNEVGSLILFEVYGLLRRKEVATLKVTELKDKLLDWSYEPFEIVGPAADRISSWIYDLVPPPHEIFNPNGIKYRGFRIFLDEGHGRNAIFVPGGLAPAEVVDTLNGLISAAELSGDTFVNTHFPALRGNEKSP